MPHIATPSGINWHYTLEGEEIAPLLFFIHGFGGSHKVWQQQVDYFLPDYRVFTVDLPGHGESSWEPVSLQDMAVDLSFICHHLKLHAVNVIASSFGGMVVLKWREYDPARLHRIVLAGALPRFTAHKNYHAGLDIDKIRTLSGQFDGDYKAILDIFFRSLFSPQDRRNEQFKVVRELWKQSVYPKREALKHFLDILENVDVRDLIATTQCPIQLIGGSEDYIATPSVMKWLYDEFDNARLEMIEGTGHLPFLARPDEFNTLVERFI